MKPKLLPDFEWFESEEYQLLYQHRDEKEAKYFITGLLTKISLDKNARILDLGCGRGRHSIFMNSLGFEVTGLDAGSKNIENARKYSNEKLDFYQHDIRNIFRINYFHLVVSLFTSFGYYSSDFENKKIIRAAFNAIQTGGYFVLDFMNNNRILKNLVAEENKNINGMGFQIKKNVTNDFLLKEITCRKNNVEKKFWEQVRLYSHEELINMLASIHFKIIEICGDYNFNPFIENQSERLILIAKKNV
ncbi:MAG: hypothetical protein A3H98_08785 [Bacteroidetes bacterium RIFCSPLOWO2_02_FULL_36_8]|nr:MAG: hypothetical protein A3H98_08785 [Bacteroidetes bacterium RIFCSPLOWO2_02_FULL_36_8]OFY71968.1 MAG: hypothetical protein A3G23_00035 [Bacteroidetes bacterium RIFCSPLOWO2_12_FULL_37_12]